MESDDSYVPALGHKRLTRFYDFFFAVAMPEKKFRMALFRQSGIERGDRVLDVGCGTGSQILLIKKLCQGADLFGLDGDIQILQIAKDKGRKAGADLTLQNALSFRLPYFDNSFDHVLSSLMFHHLSSEGKVNTAREIYRVLQSGGRLHVADFGPPQNRLMKLAAVLPGLFEHTSENVQGKLPQIFTDMGFKNVQNCANFQTIFGTLSLYSAAKRQ